MTKRKITGSHPPEETSAECRAQLLLDRRDATLSRENAVSAREAAISRREQLATEREKVNDAASAANAASVDHLMTLRVANEHLIIATLEASELADEIQLSKVQLEYVAHHDALTRLPNRILLQDRLIQAIEMAHRRGGQLALMFLDLDRFKHVNDSLGHSIGDQLLKSVAGRLAACVRRSDTVSRQGGDEFIVLLSDVEHAEDAAISAKKILFSLSEPHQIEHHDVPMCASIGISVYPDDGIDAETLLKHADTAMYSAKEQGRNGYRFFEQAMNDRALMRQSIEAGLHRALNRHEFVLHYQPKVALDSGEIVGVEALIRWQHPELGLVYPDQFVTIAEECGLILPIGRWVLREACLQAQAWRRAGMLPLTVAVNTSALEFRAIDFIENLCATLLETDMPPCFLELELTEGILMHNVAASDGVLHAVARMGVKIAIDDFGTGYSSLSYLHQFPADTLKIDKSFVSRMTINNDDATIVSAVISLGKSLNKRVIAEGVETQEQCAFLHTQNCDEGQGYFFGHPVPADILESLVRQRGQKPASACA